MGPRQCLARRSRQPSSVGHWSGYGRGAVTGRGPKPSNAAAALQGVPPPRGARYHPLEGANA